MKENVRLYRRKDGGLMLMTLRDGACRFAGLSPDGCTEIRDEDEANDEMEVLTCDYAIIKRQIWNLEGVTKGIKAETRGKRDDVLASLYKRLDTVLSRMKMIIEVFW